jgi:hypothetical protein
MPLDHLPWGRVDVDLFGYFQYQEAVDGLSVGELRSWFTFRPEWTALFERPRSYYIAANLRRGDYLGLKHIYAIISEQSYFNACAKFGLDPEALIWVAEDLRAPHPLLDGQGLAPVYKLR